MATFYPTAKDSNLPPVTQLRGKYSFNEYVHKMFQNWCIKNKISSKSLSASLELAVLLGDIRVEKKPIRRLRRYLNLTKVNKIMTYVDEEDLTYKLFTYGGAPINKSEIIDYTLGFRQLLLENFVFNS